MKLFEALVIFSAISRLALCCPDEPGCLRCSTSSAGSNQCDFCYNSFFDVTTKACNSNLPSVYNCLSYSQTNDGIFCTLCKYGYRLSGNSCVPCRTIDCAFCDENDVCLGCLNGQRLMTFTLHNYCSPIFRPGVVNCEVTKLVNNIETCVKCEDIYVLSSAGNSCLIHSQGCDQLSDDETHTCLTCSKGYYISADGKCKAESIIINTWILPLWLRIVFVLGVFFTVFRQKFRIFKSDPKRAA